MQIPPAKFSTKLPNSYGAADTAGPVPSAPKAPSRIGIALTDTPGVRTYYRSEAALDNGVSLDPAGDVEISAYPKFGHGASTVGRISLVASAGFPPQGSADLVGRSGSEIAHGASDPYTDMTASR